MTIDPRPGRERPSIHRESLPFSFVHYGGLYSTFVRFSEREDSQSFLCECSREAVENHLFEFCASRGDKPPWRFKNLPGLLDSTNDSSGLQEVLFSTPAEVMPRILFMDGICHRCNHAVPSIDYGYEICYKRTTFFAQRFGFYIQQWLHAQGLTGWGSTLPNVPAGDMVRPLLTVDVAASRKLLSQCWNARSNPETQSPLSWEDERHLRESLKRQQLALCDLAEQTLRDHFGFPPRGKLAQAEHLLFLIVSRIFEAEPIHRRAKPEWLKGLELDIYVPSSGIAFEYQGHQHASPRSFMHADEGSFVRLQERDSRKNAFCFENGVRIIYFEESDYLTEALVRERIGRPA